MEEKATIYDYVRFCNSHNGSCCKCELYNKRRVGYTCAWVLQHHTDEMNEIILKWCKEHPVKTRQEKFLEMFPNAQLSNGKVLTVCPRDINKTFNANCRNSCFDCKKSYWLAEVEE